jgi:hypothetical protein
LTTTDTIKQPKLRRRDRLLLGAAGLGLTTLLLVAAVLQPDKYGRGTHQQLGLPPCTFLMWFGRPCPTCGMTTSWACMMKGNWRDACRANLGGVLLWALAVAAAPWMLVSAARGVWWRIGPLSDVAVAWLTGVVLAVTLFDWAFRLWHGWHDAVPIIWN